jgi:hypothetical protein
MQKNELNSCRTVSLNQVLLLTFILFYHEHDIMSLLSYTTFATPSIIQDVKYSGGLETDKKKVKRTRF